MTDICTAALLSTKPGDDDSGFRHGFGVEASLPQAQSTPVVTHDTYIIYIYINIYMKKQNNLMMCLLIYDNIPRLTFLFFS